MTSRRSAVLELSKAWNQPSTEAAIWKFQMPLKLVEMLGAEMPMLMVPVAFSPYMTAPSVNSLNFSSAMSNFGAGRVLAGDVEMNRLSCGAFMVVTSELGRCCGCMQVLAEMKTVLVGCCLLRRSCSASPSSSCSSASAPWLGASVAS